MRIFTGLSNAESVQSSPTPELMGAAQEFARWGQSVGQLLDQGQTLAYTPELPQTHTLKLISFRPASGKSSVIRISAGTGIGPWTGFIRNNTDKYPMYLYRGGRDPASDFLYEPEFADRRLTQLNAAFSRTFGPDCTDPQTTGTLP